MTPPLRSVIVKAPTGPASRPGASVDGLIGELQPLDVREVVDAVTRLDAVVGHRDDVVGEVERRPVVVDDDRVVGKIALEDGGVEIVGTTRRVRVPGMISRTATS